MNSELKSEQTEIHHFTVQLNLATLKQTCHHCHLTFFSNNQLHQHFKECLFRVLRTKTMMSEVYITVIENKFTEVSMNETLINSTSQEMNKSEFEFRVYHYATVFTTLIRNEISSSVCVDTECTMFLID